MKNKILSVLAILSLTFTMTCVFSGCSDDDDETDITSDEETTQNDEDSSDENSVDDDSTEDDCEYNCGHYLNNYQAVDLGLSVKWATFNVGASKPEEFGEFFAWGETATKSSYTSNSKTYGKTAIKNFSGNSSYDAATANWGSDWKMPTLDQLIELQSSCTADTITYNGVEGYEVTGTNGNSIFFPACGYILGGDFLESDFVFFWSSTSDIVYFQDYVGDSSYSSSTSAGYGAVIAFMSENSSYIMFTTEPRYFGTPIRAVTTSDEYDVE